MFLKGLLHFINLCKDIQGKPALFMMYKIILKRNSVHLRFVIVCTVALYHTLRRTGLHFSILSRLTPTVFPIFYSQYHPEHMWAGVYLLFILRWHLIHYWLLILIFMSYWVCLFFIA
jgi:hypothetical protein